MINDAQHKFAKERKCIGYASKINAQTRNTGNRLSLHKLYIWQY